MSPMRWGMRLLERGALPDWAIRAGIRRLLRHRLRACSGPADVRQARAMEWVRTLRQSPVAVHTRAANAQHYEVPAEFFGHVLGPHRKYSACLWRDGTRDLARAEADMLALYVERAQIADGMRILDLGCGWGSLSLFLAARFPRCTIVGVSNSGSQREFITQLARTRGLANVEIVTADVNGFAPEGRFDRVVSIEMLEHVRNYERMLAQVAQWLLPDGKLFVHVFCHRDAAYPFEADGDATSDPAGDAPASADDWMSRWFFTGGQMPSDRLLLYFQRDLVIEDHWRVPGTHYQQTAAAWLTNFDRNRAALAPVLARTYGADAARMAVFWRVFFLACAELFGYRKGEEWFVAHYLFGKRA